MVSEPCVMDSTFGADEPQLDKQFQLSAVECTIFPCMPKLTFNTTLWIHEMAFSDSCFALRSAAFHAFSFTTLHTSHLSPILCPNTPLAHTEHQLHNFYCCI